MLKYLKTPIFKAEGICHLDKSTYELAFFEEERHVKSLSLEEILALPQTTLNMRMTSVSGWSVRANWQVVLWKDMVNHVGLSLSPPFVVFESPSEYTTNCYGVDILPDRWLFCHGMIAEGFIHETRSERYLWGILFVISKSQSFKRCWITILQKAILLENSLQKDEFIMRILQITGNL